MTDPFDILNLSLPSLSLYGRTRRPREPAYTLTPEEEEAWLRQIGGTLGSGIQYVGETLGKPGAAITGSLSWLTGGEAGGGLLNLIPFSDTLGITDPQKRVYTRDILENLNIAPPNQPGFGSAEDAAWDVAGFVGDVGLDPSTWFSPFFAMGKAGLAFKKAGLLPEVEKLARTAKMGKRAYRASKTGEEVLADAAAAGMDAVAMEKKLATAAAGMKRSLPELLGKKLQGHVGVSAFPLALENAGALNLGRVGEGWIKGLDWLGETIGTSAPGRYTRAMMDAGVFGTRPEEMQANTALLNKGMEASRESSMQTAQDLADLMRRGGLGEDAAEPLLRAIFEGSKDANTFQAAIGQLLSKYPNVDRGLVGEMFSHVSKARNAVKQAEEWGVAPRELRDLYADYFTRHSAPGALPTKGGKDFKLFGATYEEEIGRNPILMDYRGATKTVNQIVTDPVVAQMEQAELGKHIPGYLKQKYGHTAADLVFEEGADRAKYIKLNDQLKATLNPTEAAKYRAEIDALVTVKGKNRWEELAGFVGGLPEPVRDKGLFTNSVVWDLLGMARHPQEAMAKARYVKDVLLEKGVLGPKVEGAKRLGEVLGELGIDAGDKSKGFLRQLLGGNATKDAINALKGQYVRPDIAEGLLGLAEKFAQPKAVSEGLAFLDSSLNLFKGAVTGPWPAFLSRNLTSGQAENWFHGLFSGKYLKATKEMIRGRASGAFKDHPLVLEEAARRGLSNLTDTQATDIVRELAQRYGLTGKFEGELASVVGGAPIVEKTFKSFHESLPGKLAGSELGENFDPLRTLRKWLFMEKDTSFNPLEMRGVGGRTSSKFGPSAAGEEANTAIEALNRIPGWLKLTAKGVDPMEAKRLVESAQVSYASRRYTEFEKSVLGRLAPFYKFAKSKAVDTAKELLERPGGRLAQTIRATNALRGDEAFLPEYIARGTSIPIPEGTPVIGPKPGEKRYIPSLGLMHEDPLSFLGAGPIGALFEAGSRLRPGVKLPIELGTGRSLFQQGPQGGRDIEDMDPILGRTISNIIQLVTGQPQREAFQIPGGKIIEPGLANSFAARAASSARALSDIERKGPFGIFSNLFTGVRVTDVSPAAEDAIAREALNKVMKGMGAKQFTVTNIPNEAIAAMSPDEQKAALEAKALNAIFNKRAKERARQRELAKQGLTSVKTW